MSIVEGATRGIRKRYYNMTITRLTVYHLLYFGLCNKFIQATFLGIFGFQDYGVRCGSWVGTAFKVHHHLAIDYRSAGFILVADRDAIVERHQEGVGVPAKGRMSSTM